MWVIFGFLIILSSILEPVLHLSMGQNCGKICFGAYFPDLGVFGGSFLVLGGNFWFCKNVKALLGPVVNLGRGHNCEKKSEKLHKPILYDEKCGQKFIFKKTLPPIFFKTEGTIQTGRSSHFQKWS